MHPRKPRILVVDDDRSICELLVNILGDAGYACEMAHTGRKGLTKIDKGSFDLLILDFKLPDTTGIRVLKRVMRKKLSAQVVMISAQGTISVAVEAIKNGAYDFLEKPLDSERILVTVRNALDRGRLERERARLLESVKEQYVMVGECAAMEEIRKFVLKAADTNSKVLIEGENGTGKELVARAIHLHSSRAGERFVAMNCAAIPETLIESELFGYKKGAFTGATSDKLGRFQMADGGTLFLDEVGDMSVMTQAKVLRVLEEGKIEMLGGDTPIPVDVRVIAATNKDLQARMDEEKFREDLYYRLDVLNIKVPPLRDRKGDIPLLVEYFIRRSCDEHGIVQKQVTSRAMGQLVNYPWPGNVRELKNFIERLVVLVEAEKVDVPHLSSILKSYAAVDTKSMVATNLREAREDFEREFIREKVIACNFNISRAAELMGIPRPSLHKKIKKHGLTFKSED